MKGDGELSCVCRLLVLTISNPSKWSWTKAIFQSNQNHLHIPTSVKSEPLQFNYRHLHTSKKKKPPHKVSSWPSTGSPKLQAMEKKKAEYHEHKKWWSNTQWTQGCLSAPCRRKTFWMQKCTSQGQEPCAQAIWKLFPALVYLVDISLGFFPSRPINWKQTCYLARFLWGFIQTAMKV